MLFSEGVNREEFHCSKGSQLAADQTVLHWEGKTAWQTGKVKETGIYLKGAFRKF